MHAPAGEAVDEPGVDGAEEELAALGAGAGALDVVQHPLHLGGREVGVDDEAAALADEGLAAAGLEGIAERGGAPALPDDGVAEGPAAPLLPDHGRLSLVGDADGGDLPGRNAGLAQDGLRRLELRRPDVLGVVLHPAGLGVDLGELAALGGDGLCLLVEEDGAGAGGALVQGEDVPAHETLRMRNGRRARPPSGKCGASVAA